MFGRHNHGGFRSVPLVSEEIRTEEKCSYEFKKGYTQAMKDVLKAHTKGGNAAIMELVEKHLPNDFWM